MPFFSTSYLFIFCFKVYDGIVSQQSEVLEWNALALRAHFLLKKEKEMKQKLGKILGILLLCVCIVWALLACNNTFPENGATLGLEYKISDDGKSYTVIGIGSCEDSKVSIPSTHLFLPVTRIGNNAFSNCS